MKVVLQRDWCENRELDIVCTLVAMLCVLFGFMCCHDTMHIFACSQQRKTLTMMYRCVQIARAQLFVRLSCDARAGTG